MDNLENYPVEIFAAENEKLRLVPTFKISYWNGSGLDKLKKFIPDKEADMLVLRIIDRIKQTIK